MKKSEEIALNKQIRNSFSFNRINMLLCKDYFTKNGIRVRQPRMGEIINQEEEFYKNLSIWVTNPTSYRLSLWHNKVDWCKITDYELFVGLYKGIDPEVIRLVLPDINMQSFEQSYKVLGEDEYELVLYSKDDDLLIDNYTYLEISQYLRTMFNIFPKDEYAKGKATKESIIFEEEEKLAREKKQGEFQSTLFPLVSFLINSPGFKYGPDNLDQAGIFYCMDAAVRIPSNYATLALHIGSMSGFADMSKVPQDNFNFCRDLYVSKDKRGAKLSQEENNEKVNSVLSQMKL